VKSHLHVVQKRAVSNRGHLSTVQGLGLRGPHSEVWVKNTPSFRGAVKKVMHLVTVEEVDAPPAPASAPRSGAATAKKAK
jgi:large subunit ribosomal protein L30